MPQVRASGGLRDGRGRLHGLPRLPSEAARARQAEARAARTAAALNHPNIIPVYAVGRDKDHEYIARKIRFGSPSDAGAHTRETLMTVLHSLKKRTPHVAETLKAVRDQLGENPALDPFTPSSSLPIRPETTCNCPITLDGGSKECGPQLW